MLTACEPGTTDPILSSTEPAEFRAAAPVALDWNQTARGLVATNNLNALVTGRIFAAVGMAQHQAVQAVDAPTSAS